MTGSARRGHPQLDGVLRHFVGSVTVSALRHHVDDLQQLLPHLLRKLAPRRPVACTPGAMRVLLGYGNRVKAAGILGIARSSLYRKIDVYGIRPLE